eukprot:3452019-Amphidinium_carterae.1
MPLIFVLSSGKPCMHTLCRPTRVFARLQVGLLLAPQPCACHFETVSLLVSGADPMAELIRLATKLDMNDRMPTVFKMEDMTR